MQRRFWGPRMGIVASSHPLVVKWELLSMLVLLVGARFIAVAHAVAV